MRPIRTRFAPSPTGFLHIGGVRTALFNWLYARQHDGAFVLRIDDTDAGRNVGEALEPILHGFRWLGIDWDEGPRVGGGYGPYYQSERQDLYRAAAAELVARGHAYRDYARPEELAAERQAAESDKRRFLYSRRWAAWSEDEAARFEAEGRQAVVRLKMPREGVCRFTDRVRGEMEFEWAREQDHVIQRADGSCLYHLASAVDDHAMAISHVIRAEEHLSNTPRQIWIMHGLGYELPEYAHLSYVAEPGSKVKLSKRKLAKYLKDPAFAELDAHGRRIAEAIGLETEADTFNPVIVDFYERVGFLPDALLNYLLLLGWSLDDRTEEFDRPAMIESFSLERVQSSPASFDPAKLVAFQERWMERTPVAERARRALPYLERAGWVPSPPDDAATARVEAIVAAAGDRIKVAGDILDYADFFTPSAELDYDEKAFEKRIARPEGAAERLARYRARLVGIEPWREAELESSMRDFCDAEEIGLGKIVHAVRVAVTGKAVGFGMFETLEIVGRDETLARIDRALAMAAGDGAGAVAG